MTDGDGKASLIGELLQFELPQPSAGTVAAATVAVIRSSFAPE